MSQAGIPPSYLVSSGADWKRPYQYAILELDRLALPKCPIRITLARHAILDRAEEIMTRFERRGVSRPQLCYP